MILFICDSRGRDLYHEISRFTSEPIHVTINSGATLYQSGTRSRREITRYMPKQIYILSGINNLTNLERATRQVQIQERNILKAADLFMNELENTYEYIRNLTGSNIKIITAPVTGMSLASYNGRLLQDPEDQNLLNDTVIEINNRIIALNEGNGVRTPWTSAIIHRYYRGKYHFSYHRLSMDGCHLTDEIREFWAKKLADAIDHNR